MENERMQQYRKKKEERARKEKERRDKRDRQKRLNKLAKIEEKRKKERELGKEKKCSTEIWAKGKKKDLIFFQVIHVCYKVYIYIVILLFQ